MVDNPNSWEVFTGGADAKEDEAPAVITAMNALRGALLESSDITPAVIYLASDESRLVTGTSTVIDAGALLPFKIPHC
jgi:NAD(P)-dependent dehydrogenase (short-subunit alcohol dehydrogenase family)